MNKGHAMAWVSFGLSIAALIMMFFLNIPLLFIILGIICLILVIADIIRSGKSIPAIIALCITVFVMILSGFAWYANMKAYEEI